MDEDMPSYRATTFQKDEVRLLDSLYQPDEDKPTYRATLYQTDEVLPA